MLRPSYTVTRQRKKGGATARPAASKDPTPRAWIWNAILIGAVLGLIGIQLWWTVVSAHQIRMEELAESVRNVYWLEHGRIYDGISSNVGWYATELLTYRLVGFEIYTAKGIRLALHLASLICVALLLRRWLGPRGALAPLLAWGLSPTLLHFNTMQTSYGTDLQFAPICLLLMLSVRFQRRHTDLLLGGLAWAMCCWACMSYPAFLFYLPALAAVHLWRWRAAAASRGTELPWRVRHLAAAAAGFLLPLILTLAVMQEPGRLINDPATGAGLFRGGGKLNASPEAVATALGATARDLLVRGESYYFNLPRPDFAGPLGWAALLLCLGGGALALRRAGPTRRWALLILSLLLLSLVLPAFTSKGYPGLRRCTGVVAALYLFYVLAWKHALAALTPTGRGWRRLALPALLLLLPLHHLMSAPANLEQLRQKDPYREEMWFELRGEPRASLAYILEATHDGKIPLKCLGANNRPIPCRYSEIFAAMDGYRMWNGLPRAPVRAFDWRTGNDIELHLDLWTRGHFPR